MRFLPLDELLAAAEVVTLHLPHRPGEAPLLDAGRLDRMKPGAILINTSRGALVDEQALYRVLSDGMLGGAYLDVFAGEPYEGPLTELPNVLLTPHIGSYAAECRLRMETEAVEQVLEFFGRERGS